VSVLYHVDATGDVGPASGGILASVVITADSAASSVTLKEGGSGGTTILKLGAVANDSHQAEFRGVSYTGQLHATIAGTNAVASVELE